MLPVLMWIDKHTEEEDFEGGSCIYDLAFKPDGTELLVAIGRRIIVHDPNDGSVIAQNTVHKELVYALAFAHNGAHYASGSQDKTVIIWSEKHEGLLKYSHHDAIQCLAFSPVTDLLISGACEDYGVWILKDTNVSKQKVSSRCTSCQFNVTGAYFAIGYYDGSVSLHFTTSGVGELICRVERPGGEPVWAMHFASIATKCSFNNMSQGEMLVVADWSQSVGFYALENGTLQHKTDRSLDYDPTGVHLFSNGCFFLSIGSNKKLNLHNKDGSDLGALAQLDAWPWSMAFRQKLNSVVIGCTDGSLACYQLMTNTIHALHKDRYVFRENQTDVVIQQLHTRKSTQIRSNDLVRKVAIYNNRLAIQLTEKILIYRQASGEQDGEQLEYRLLDRINCSHECLLLVVCTNHVILCQDMRLTCLDLKGVKQREWIMESPIRYIKVVGGPPGRETILVGLRYGLVSKIFVDNPFPLEVLRLKTVIRCIDISASKRRLATADDDGVCVIYDIEEKKILNQEPGVFSVAFNSDNEDLICYSGNGYLHVKSHDMTPYQHKLEKLESSHPGFVVAFMGKCVYILHMYSMQCLEMPLTSQLVQLLEHKMYKEAYALACLGVTDRDWQLLGEEMLENLQFVIAKKCYHRLRDSRMLLLIYELEEMQKRGATQSALRAVICAHRSRFRLAVQHFQATGEEQKALEMFAELQMFDHAQEFLASASKETQRQLLRRKAQWAQNDSNDAYTAAELLMSAGDYTDALRIMMANDWVERVVNAARKLDCADSVLLREVGQYLARRGEFTIATSIFTRIHDFASIVRMHVDAQHWEDALAIVRQNPSLNIEVYLPYARWLSEQDRFDDAQVAYSKAGAEAEAAYVLCQLTENAVRESRFHDASCYYRRRAAQLLEQFVNDRQENVADVTRRWTEFIELADIYFAYDAVFRYAVEPFTDKSLDILFNMARFLTLHHDAPHMSRVIVLFTLMKLSQHFANYKTARHAVEQLRALRAASQYQGIIDVTALEIRAKPFADTEQSQPMCYSCGTSNPILGAHKCVHCDATFVYSFSTFEVLPLVEVALEDGITDAEAEKLIRAEPPDQFNIARIAMNRKRDRVLPRLSCAELHNLGPNMVFVCSFRTPIVCRYFVKVIEEINVSKCDYCQRFFHADDYQMAVLQTSRCPTCRTRADAKTAPDETVTLITRGINTPNSYGVSSYNATSHSIYPLAK